MRTRSWLAGVVVTVVVSGCGSPRHPAPSRPGPATSSTPEPSPSARPGAPRAEDAGERPLSPPPASVELPPVEVPELTAANPRRIEAWLAGMEADVERLCRCPDLACAQRVLTDGQGLGLPKGQLTPDEAARVNAAMQRLATCYADLQRAPSSP